MSRLRLGVLISGSGSNLQAIIDASERGELDADIAVVISNRQDAFGLERAQRHGIAGRWIDPASFGSAAEYNAAVRDELLAAEVDHVVMAGYMKLLGTEVLDAFPMRVLNLHPALLPSFPGAHGIADALAYGVKVTGVTVHFADAEFDRGPIIAQQAVEVCEDDTEESLAARIHEAEHRIYPYAIQLIARGRITIEGRRVRVSPEA